MIIGQLVGNIRKIECVNKNGKVQARVNTVINLEVSYNHIIFGKYSNYHPLKNPLEL
jgi:hypothetical protein